MRKNKERKEKKNGSKNTEKSKQGINEINVTKKER
jgi:hypothetical protein